MSTADRAARDEFVAELAAIDEKCYGQASNDLSPQELRALGERERQIRKLYFQSLPDIPVGRCPFTNAIAYQIMDLFGFDGPWWHWRFDAPFARGGRHFLTFMGAMRFGDRALLQSADKDSRILFGPEVPFVMPRLLAREGECCVLSSLEAFDGRAVIYLVSYYAQAGAAAKDYHQEWLRGEYTVTYPDGRSEFNMANDAWDFDIAAWIARPGKVYWISAGDADMRLRQGASGCPYLNLPGERRMQVFEKGELALEAPPSGIPLDKDGLFD